MFPRLCHWWSVLACLAMLTHEGAETERRGRIDLLDDQFLLPPDFHIYRAAGAELCGGSYDIAFDGAGQLLVGDGQAIRRLRDRDGDGQFDEYEVIASGLGWRGPQGLLIDGTNLYAVGGDGIQLFEGYSPAARPQHRGRIGPVVRTGGDHDGHTLLRGFDGYLYFVAGDGSGTQGRSHITEGTSPVLRARNASVFRISPDGKRWECLSTGGRNPPNLGLNLQGDFFSLDSDMEWHVGLPWYRPVRLNHWLWGGDQGWQQVGAYPSYYLDALPGIVEVGRGSPDWGIFYEHTQFPGEFQDDYFVCDYRWKAASSDRYGTTGRLLCFDLSMRRGEWKATYSRFAEPKPGAKDRTGRPIDFALVDIDVAPDGSLFVSDHNQGVWRIFYGRLNAEGGPVPAIAVSEAHAGNANNSVLQLLSDPQPNSAWTRQRQEAVLAKVGPAAGRELEQATLEEARPLRERLRALHLLAPRFGELSADYVKRLTMDRMPEVRAQGAWLMGLRLLGSEEKQLIGLAADHDAYVRRRATEALTRGGSAGAIPVLLERLGDPNRFTRFAAMAALAHHPPEGWLEQAVWKTDPQIRMRALVALVMRKEAVRSETLQAFLPALLQQVDSGSAREERLDLLRLLGILRESVKDNAELYGKVSAYLLSSFPDGDAAIRWEQVRLLGAYVPAEGIRPLLGLLERESDPVAQFHIAEALGKQGNGWAAEDAERFFKWLLTTQEGWFAEWEEKGVEFPQFWLTVLEEFGERHPELFLRSKGKIHVGSLMGSVLVQLVRDRDDGFEKLVELYQGTSEDSGRAKVLRAFQEAPSLEAAEFIRAVHGTSISPVVKEAALIALAHQPADSKDGAILSEGVRSGSPEIAALCARAMSRRPEEVSREVQGAFLERLILHPGQFRTFDRALRRVSGKSSMGGDGTEEPNRAEREAAIAFWKDWYRTRYGTDFEREPRRIALMKTNEELIDFIRSEQIWGGEFARGLAVYERLQCQTCHGGGRSGKAAVFAPDLAGVTRRLTRVELAQALVLPSMQVADRFRGTTVRTKDELEFSGIITEQSPEAVTLVERDQVRRFRREEIESLVAQTASLMPEGLLNTLTAEEIRDLLAFLDQQGNP